MSKVNKPTDKIWLIGLLCLAIGLGFTIYNVKEYSSHKQRAKEYTGYLAKLDRLQQEASRHASIRKQFSIMQGKAPKPLRQIADSAGMDDSVNIREQATVPLEPGLSVQSVTVSSANLPYNQVSRLLQLAEIDHPPWRLVSATLKASPSSTKEGQVDFTFEAIDGTF